MLNSTSPLPDNQPSSNNASIDQSLIQKKSSNNIHTTYNQIPTSLERQSSNVDRTRRVNFKSDKEFMTIQTHFTGW